jgi:hypothetical protein
MDIQEAVDRVLLGEPLGTLGAHWRAEALQSVGLDPEEARPETFRKEAIQFLNKVCRRLGERHQYDSRAEAALITWARRIDEYDVFDSLLSNFKKFEGRDSLVRRGRQLFPGPLTAHWDDTW